jgi:hypothetical protein
MSTRLLTALAVAAAAALSLLALSGTASADAVVFNAVQRGDMTQLVTQVYNDCDLSQGIDSPKFTITNGSYQEQATVVQVNDGHYVVTLHGVTQFQGIYPDGTHVAVNSTFNASETVNVDVAALEQGQLVLDSALVVTVTMHDGIHVQGQNYPGGKYEDANLHLTYTPDLKLASIVVDYRDGC